MMKTTQPTMTVKRLPSQSARSPAMRAPKKVPAERIDVMSEFSHEGRPKASFWSLVALLYRHQVSLSGA